MEKYFLLPTAADCGYYAKFAHRSIINHMKTKYIYGPHRKFQLPPTAWWRQLADAPTKYEKLRSTKLADHGTNSGRPFNAAKVRERKKPKNIASRH
jgi:hypothetical protein